MYFLKNQVHTLKTAHTNLIATSQRVIRCPLRGQLHVICERSLVDAPRQLRVFAPQMPAVSVSVPGMPACPSRSAYVARSLRSFCPTGQAGHSLSAPRPTSCHLILRCASAAPSVCPCKHGLPSVPASCPPSSLLGQAFVRLVAVSSIHYCTSTPALSTSSSSRGLISLGGEVSSWRGLHA